ncbi:MAG: hypothetical protein J5969_04805 [Lachnospiraceae bacterium]|nr:hypothetical protein [Lachnospiraceae bacterium]
MVIDVIRNKRGLSRALLCLLLIMLLAAALPGRGQCAEISAISTKEITATAPEEDNDTPAENTPADPTPTEQKTLPDGTAGSVIMDAAALFFMSGILIYTALYRKRGRLDDKLFFGMVLTNMALAASDATAYLLEGRPFTEAGKMIVACNVVFYAAFEIFPYLFLLFLDFRVRKEPEHVRKSSVLYCIPALVIVVLLLFNLRTGWLYSVSKNNIYHTGPYNDVVFLPVAVYSVLILAKLYRIDRRLTLLGIILILARVGFGFWFRSISSTAMTYTLFLVATHIGVMNRTIKEEVL